MLWSQRRKSGAQGAENFIQISALAVVEPRTLASRLPCTPPFSRLLRHARGYSRTILTPNLQGFDLLHAFLIVLRTQLSCGFITNGGIVLNSNNVSPADPLLRGYKLFCDTGKL